MQMQNMGGMGGLMGMLPGVAKMKNQIANANIDDKVIKRQVAIIDSMTPKERRNPDILKASRKKRIAAGSGTKAEDINKLLKMHRTMADMMKAMGSGKRGPLAGLGQCSAWAAVWAAACRRRKRWPSSPRRCRAACPGHAGPAADAGHAQAAAEFPRQRGAGCRAWAARNCRRDFPAWGRRNEFSRHPRAASREG